MLTMNDLAYIDVENDGNFCWAEIMRIDMIRAPPDALKLYKLCQFGLQYMMNTVSKLGDNVLLVKDYIKIQDDKRAKLTELLQSQVFYSKID